MRPIFTRWLILGLLIIVACLVLIVLLPRWEHLWGTVLGAAVVSIIFERQIPRALLESVTQTFQLHSSITDAGLLSALSPDADTLRLLRESRQISIFVTSGERLFDQEVLKLLARLLPPPGSPALDTDGIPPRVRIVLAFPRSEPCRHIDREEDNNPQRLELEILSSLTHIRTHLVDGRSNPARVKWTYRYPRSAMIIGDDRARITLYLTRRGRADKWHVTVQKPGVLYQKVMDSFEDTWNDDRWTKDVPWQNLAEALMPTKPTLTPEADTREYQS